MEEFKSPDQFWVLFTEKGDQEFRTMSLKKFETHEMLTNKDKAAKLIRRIKNVEAEVASMKGMRKGRNLKRFRSDPHDDTYASTARTE